MDLAEKEHRLRDEWVTYAQAGFRAHAGLIPQYPDDERQGAATVSSRLALQVRGPQGAGRELAEDAARWLACWTQLLGEMALPSAAAAGDET